MDNLTDIREALNNILGIPDAPDEFNSSRRFSTMEEIRQFETKHNIWVDRLCAIERRTGRSSNIW
jgi:hypothetical protein